MHSMQGQGNPCKKSEKNTGHLFFEKNVLYFYNSVFMSTINQSVRCPVRQKFLLLFPLLQ